MVLLTLVVLHKVPRSIFDHEVLRFVLRALWQRLILRFVVLMEFEWLHREALIIQVLTLENLHMIIGVEVLRRYLLSFLTENLDYRIQYPGN